MSIKPNVIILQEEDSSINSLDAVLIQQIPRVFTSLSDNDSDYIDTIRTQPLPNELEKNTMSSLSDDIAQMIKLIGAYCKTNSIDEIQTIIREIHDTLPTKAPTIVKNWVRLLTGLHPKLDQFIDSLQYWKKPYSEVIGTNTIMYYADTSSIDIMNWGSNPRYLTNQIMWTTSPWKSPSYLRESVRQKLSNDVVEYVMLAGQTTSKLQKRNLVREAVKTTAPLTGAEERQKRPISGSITHGVSLNNDWYNQTARVMPENKPMAREEAIAHLDEGGAKVHVLVNHLQPLEPKHKAVTNAVQFSTPQGVEETFPHRNPSLGVVTDLNSNRVLRNPTSVDDTPIEPKQEEDKCE